MSDQNSSQLSIRSVVTGMVIGGIFSLCNLYIGLKSGWGIGLSVPAAIFAYGFWRLVQVTKLSSGFSIIETNISQTAASAAASISGAGLIAHIPALTMLDNEQTFTWPVLVLWTFSVCLVGITISIGLRKPMIIEDSLPFPSGLATGNTLMEMYAHGKDAMIRLQLLCLGAMIAAAIKIPATIYKWPPFGLPGEWKTKTGGTLEKAGITSFSFSKLGFGLDPTLMMYGVGALIGPRVGISILIGSLTAWGILAPIAFESGWAPLTLNNKNQFEMTYASGRSWLLWPAVSLMICASLTSVAFSWKSMVKTFRRSKDPSDTKDDKTNEIPRRWFYLCLLVVTAISVILQVLLFRISPSVATMAVLLAFILSMVATRVSGETNVGPISAMSSFSQLFFAIIAPGSPQANTMTANVTAGAASQCGDMMHDLKTGHMINAKPGPQFIAQIFGALAGALVGCAGYLLLINGPAKDLGSKDWPAPTVMGCKAVAELFSKGGPGLPPEAANAMIIAAVVGIALVILEKTLPQKARNFVPSPVSMGLAFVITAPISFALFIGAMTAWILGKWIPSWTARFLVIFASGLITGESLSGVFLAAYEVFFKK